MNACEYRISQIYLLLDNELPKGEEAELRFHLGSCPGCAAELEKLEKLSAAVDERLEAKFALPDDANIARHAATKKIDNRMRRFVFRALKKTPLASAAVAAVVVVSASLFVHFYFQRTFSHELKGVVIRCSDGIEISSGGKWKPLSAGKSLGKSARMRTPEGSQSFMAFDGIRALTDGRAEFERSGQRALSVISGEIVLASAERDLPVQIGLRGATVQTNGGVLRVEQSENEAYLGVAVGTAEITMPDGTTHNLVADQSAVLGGGSEGFTVVSGEVIDPFARMKVSAIDRTRQRFEKMISKYLPGYRMTMQGSGANPRTLFARPEEMYRFASYTPEEPLLLARENSQRFGDYYESLFAPSNRSISIGRQKTIRIKPGNAPGRPTWSHDGSMIAYPEYDHHGRPAAVKVVRLDDLEHPWVISQECELVLPMFPLAWAPDDRHVLFMMSDNVDSHGAWEAPYKIKIAPIDPSEGPLREFNSPFSDIPLELPLPIGKTLSPQILKLPWGDAVLCANWGNIGYIPIEEDGQSVSGSSGLFLTDFNPREFFVAGGKWSPSGNKITFMAIENLQVNPVNAYILYDVEDILDGFAEPPRSVDDPRIKRISPSNNGQFCGGFSFDESLTFFEEDVSGAWRGKYPTDLYSTDFDLFFTDAAPDQQSAPTQIHLPGNQIYLTPSPESNRIVYRNDYKGLYELRIVSFDIEADMDMDLGGVLIDNSGTNLIVPPGTLEENFGVTISTPFTIGEEAELTEGENTFFAMRLLDAKGLKNPKFIEPMTLTIRYTDDEVAGLDEGMLKIYYYDESDPENPKWVPMGGTVDPEYNEITVEIRHFSKYAIGGRPPDGGR